MSLHTIDERLKLADRRAAVERFPCLKDLRIARLADGGRIQTEHAVQHGVLFPSLPLAIPKRGCNRPRAVAV